MFALILLLAVPPATLTAEPAVVELGERFIGQPLNHTFQITNRGSTTINVTEVGVTCGCMTPKLDQRIIKPGETVPLAIEVNTLSQPAGPLGWRVRVAYAINGVPQELGLELRATLIGELMLQPASLAFSKGAGRAHVISLTDTRTKTLNVTGVGTSSNKLTAELLPVDGDQIGVRLVKVTVADNCPEGKHNEIVLLTTDDPKYRELRLPVSITQPTRFSVSALPGTATVSATESALIQLRDKDNRPVKIAAMKADGPFTSNWAPGPGTFATLRITLDTAHWDKKAGRGSMTITLQEPVRETIVVPVSIKGGK